MRWLKFRVWYRRYPQPKDGEMRYFRQSEDDFANSCRKYQSDDWMQYTGLKDCKGKDIYENDIVEYKQRNLSKAFGLNGENEEDFIKKTRQIIFAGQSFNVPEGFIKDLEIIGNIYENPELR